MQDQTSSLSESVSRRQFIKSTTVAAAAAVSFPAVVSAQTKPPINAVIIGVGGRGSGAGENFKEAAKIAGGEANIVAVGGLFPAKTIRGQEGFGRAGGRSFSGVDSYQKAQARPRATYA